MVKIIVHVCSHDKVAG